MKNQIISFKTAKLAKKKEFGLGKDYIYLHTYYNSKTKELTSEPTAYKRNKLNTPHGQLQLENVEVGVSRGMDNSCKEYILAPTQSLLQKWLRKKHDIHVNPTPYFESVSDNSITGYYVGEVYTTKGETLYHGDDNYLTYEEALEKGLQEALKLI